MSDDAALLGELARECLALRTASRAAGDDTFPRAAIDMLRRLGVLAAPMPRDEGGRGWGTRPDGMRPLGEALQLIGRGGLALGRVFEAHVNAIALIDKFGEAPVRRTAWSAVRDGHLFGLWVSPSARPVRLSRRGPEGFHIVGIKGFCSGAGVATRAVVTALDELDRAQMLLIDATRTDAGDGVAPRLHGMRATATRPVAFDMSARACDLIGGPDDYVREPDFSAGAWRASAVTAGGARALVEETIRQLRERGRHRDPHQSARIGQMLIRSRTAAMWADAMADRAAMERDDLTAFVGLGRIAIEQASLEMIPLAQRGLGLAAFVEGNAVEGLARDLATYLRQPAGDEVLSEAAVRYAEAGGR